MVATVPAVMNMGLFLAKSQGFFQAEGLNVNIQPVQSSTVAVAGQLHGSIDITAGAYVSYILAQAGTSSAASWHILAEGAISRPRSQQVLVAKNSPIKSMAQQGKTVASNILDNIGTLLVQSALTEHNIPVSSVNWSRCPFPTWRPPWSRETYDLVWWIASEQPGLIGHQFAALGGPKPGADLEVTRRAVTARLHEMRRWLRVFDASRFSP